MRSPLIMPQFARSFLCVLPICTMAFLSVPMCGQFADPTILDKSDVYAGQFFPGERIMDVADLDQDGLDDILLLGFLGPIWYKGTPTGFETARQVGSREEECVRDIRAGDLNGDGLLDIFTVNSQGDGMIWYQNLGGGDFSSVAMPVTAFAVHQCQHFSELADVDADGDLDLVIAWEFGVGIRWFRNNGAGVFSSDLNIISDGNGKNGISDFVVDDIDGDGDMDVISANNNVIYDGLFVTLKGTNAFGTALDILPVGLFAFGIAVGDLDGDGLKDIAFSSNNPESIRILQKNGSGGYDLSSLVLAGHLSGDLEMADVDGDGRLDLLSAPPSRTAARTIINRNTSDGTLSFEQVAGIGHEELAQLKVWSRPSGTRILSLEAAPEGGAYVRIHQFVTGSNTWSSEYVSAKVPRNALLAVDMNADGAMDMLGCDAIGSAVTLYTQGPDGLEFTAEVLFTGPGRPAKLRTGDFDGDGDRDIVTWARLTGATGSTGLFFLRNNGVNGFAHDTLLAYVPTSFNANVQVVDLDADGDLDIFLSFNDDNLLRWYENDGNGSFTPSSNSFLSVTPRSLTLLDFNLDGLIDIVFNTSTQALRWLRNDGELAFTLMPFSASGPAGIEVADIDNDGDGDLYTFAGGSLNWWRRTGALTFDPTISNPLPVAFMVKTLLDLDADGTLDLICEQSNFSEWYRGIGNGIFESIPRSIYVGVIATAFDGKPSLFVDLDQDGDKEIVLRVLVEAQQQPQLLLLENLSVIGTEVQEHHQPSLSALPNPFMDHTTLRSGGALTPHHVVQLCDVQGRVLRILRSTHDGQVLIDRGSLAAGFYLVRVLSATGVVQESLRLVAE